MSPKSDEFYSATKMHQEQERRANWRRIRYAILGAVVFLSLITGACTVGCSRVTPGWVAIKVNQMGGDRGVEPHPIGTGYVFYLRPWTDVYLFPTFTQTSNWTANADDDGRDDGVRINSSKGAQMSTDISLAYHFEPDKVPAIFQAFRKDADQLTHTYVLQRIRDHFTQEASKMEAEDILGNGKVKLLEAVTKSVQAELTPKGIIIENISFYGDMRIDERVRQAVNAVFAARQQAEQARQEVERERAEADKKIQAARGVAESIKLKADAEFYANEKLNLSITDKVLQFRALDKWSGQVPMVTGGGAVPFVTLPSGKQ